MRIMPTIMCASILLTNCAHSPQKNSDDVSYSEATISVRAASEINWEKLNPARGDKSPLAGTLWGDRKGEVPTGFLAKFTDGFSSPPHIHNVTYRAVVLNGLIHNDDPSAATMWMTPGSFWTQPKGEVHITSAKGPVNIALVEIDQGPYLVSPPQDASEHGERPVNIDASNIVWISPFAPKASQHGPKQAYLWGEIEEGKSNGTFLKLPAGYNASIRSKSPTFHAVVIQGTIQHLGAKNKTLEPGSYFGSQGASVHRIAANVGAESILYIRTTGAYDIVHEEDRSQQKP